jgi:hypothetical protein
LERPLNAMRSAGGGIRTHEPLRDEVLSLAPLTRLGDPRVVSSSQSFGLIILIDLYHMNSCSIYDSIFLVSVVRRIHWVVTKSVSYYCFCLFERILSMFE